MATWRTSSRDSGIEQSVLHQRSAAFSEAAHARLASDVRNGAQDSRRGHIRPMSAGIPATAPMHVKTMRPAATMAILGAHLTRLTRPRAATVAKIPVPMEPPATMPNAARERPTAEGSPRNHSRKEPHKARTAAPESKAHDTHFGGYDAARVAI